MQLTNADTIWQTILFEYNVQHDCKHANCVASGTKAVMQERVQSGRTEMYIEHKFVSRYLINTHAFHNAHLIRAILPRHLTVPIPYAQDREAHHNRIAANFRVSQDTRRVANALKAAEKKKARNANQEKTADKGKKRMRTEESLEHEDAMIVDSDNDQRD